MYPRTRGRYLLAAFASVLLGSLSAVADTVFVDWQNYGVHQDGTDAHPYRTLPQAFAAAAPGDTIAIRKGGCYSLEGGMLSKSVTIRADNGLVTIRSSGIDSSALPPTLVVSSFLASYPPGVKPSLGVRLALAFWAGAPWLVTNFDYGTLSIATVTRNGIALSPTVGPVNFLEDPKLAREAGLTALRPGQEVAIPFDVTQEPFNNGYGIRAVAFDSLDAPFRAHLGFSYNLIHPGAYTLRLRYLYTGPRKCQAGVFSQAIESNDISFELQ